MGGQSGGDEGQEKSRRWLGAGWVVGGSLAGLGVVAFGGLDVRH